MLPPPLLIVAGTRPEALKVAPLAQHLGIPVRWCWSGQQPVIPPETALLHWERLPSPTHPLSRATLLRQLQRNLRQRIDLMRPAAVLVQGDTATALAGASAAAACRTPLIHLEAGLRSGNPRAPFPEEIHRLRIARIAALHLAPSALAHANLLAEGVPAHCIEWVGSTAIDHLPMVANRPAARFDLLVEVHRREHRGRPVRRLARALLELARQGARIALVDHPNPAWVQRWNDLLGASHGLVRLDPMPRLRWLALATSSRLVLSDSGGAAEELPYLGIPLLMFRAAVERPEALHSDHARQLDPCAPDAANQIRAALHWADDERRPWPRQPDAPYGDGHAARRAARAIQRHLADCQRAPIEVRAQAPT